MKTIFKFELYPGGSTDIGVPNDAKLLTVQEQYGLLQLWVEMDDSAPTVRRQVMLLGTGWAIPEHKDITYMCTVQSHGYVWHAYEVH